MRMCDYSVIGLVFLQTPKKIGEHSKRGTLSPVCEGGFLKNLHLFGYFIRSDSCPSIYVNIWLILLETLIHNNHFVIFYFARIKRNRGHYRGTLGRVFNFPTSSPINSSVTPTY